MHMKYGDIDPRVSEFILFSIFSYSIDEFSEVVDDELLAIFKWFEIFY